MSATVNRLRGGRRGQPRRGRRAVRRAAAPGHRRNSGCAARAARPGPRRTPGPGAGVEGAGPWPPDRPSGARGPDRAGSATARVAATRFRNEGRPSPSAVCTASVARTSAQACSTSSSTSPTSLASASTVDDTPSMLRTCVAKPWMVVMVAASNSVTARRSCPAARLDPSPSGGGGARHPRGRACRRPGPPPPPSSGLHTGPQLTGGRSCERDDEQLRRRNGPLGDEPGGQGGQRERLTGAGTGLHGPAPGPEIADRVERGGDGTVVTRRRPDPRRWRSGRTRPTDSRHTARPSPRSRPGRPGGPRWP